MPPVSLAKKLLRGSVISLGEHGVKIAVVFVTTPLMIRHLGEHDYGLWIFALAIIGYLRLLDLGLSLTGNRFLGHAIGTGEAGRYYDHFVAFSYLFNRIGLASLLLTLALVLLAPVILPGDERISEGRWILLGLGFLTSIHFWTQVHTLVLKSHLRYDWIGAASIAKTVVQGAVLIVLLSRGHGLYSLVLAFLLTDLLDQILLIFLSRRVYPEGGFLFVRRRPPGLAPILRFSGTAVLASLGNQFRNGIDPLIIGHFAGLPLVPIYSIGSRFLSLFTDLINAVFGGNFLAAFSQLDGRRDQDGLTRHFLTSLRFSTAFASAGGGFLVLFGPAFIERWIGPGFADSGKVLLLLAGPTTLMLMQYPVGNFFYSRNLQRWLVYTGLGGGLFNAILSTCLVLKIGFFGVVWGTFIELVLHFGIAVPLLTARSCGLKLRTYLGRLFRSALPYLLLLGLFAAIIPPYTTPAFGRLFLLGSVFALFLTATFWGVTLTAEERTLLRQHLARFGRSSAS